jgi:hypothetical protein
MSKTDHPRENAMKVKARTTHVNLLAFVVVGVRHAGLLCGGAGHARRRRDRLVHIGNFRLIVVVAPAQIAGARGRRVPRNGSGTDAIAPRLGHVAGGHHCPAVVGGHSDMAVGSDVPPVEGPARGAGDVRRNDSGLMVRIDGGGASGRLGKVAGAKHQSSTPAEASANYKIQKQGEACMRYYHPLQDPPSRVGCVLP